MPTTTRIATSSEVPPIAPPMETSLIRAPAASRNSTGPRSPPVLTCAVVPFRACSTRAASSPVPTPGAGSTPMALTCPSRAASRRASSSLKKSAFCRARSPRGVVATPLTRYVFGSPVDCTGSSEPGFSPAPAASARSTTTSPACWGARPSVSVKGVSAAEVQAWPYEGFAPPGALASGTAWNVSSGTARSTPGTARTASTVAAGSQARSATGFALCLVLVLPFFSLTVVSWTFWSAETRTGEAA